MSTPFSASYWFTLKGCPALNQRLFPGVQKNCRKVDSESVPVQYTCDRDKMISKEHSGSFTIGLIGRVLLLFVAVIAPVNPGLADSEEANEAVETSVDESVTPEVPTHMPEAVRSSVRKVVVLASPSPAGNSVTGSYEDETKGLLEGSISGSQIGKGIGTEVGGIPIGIPFPILTLPGAIIGGISGATKREIQEFRDELTDELAKAASQPLTNDALASDVFWGLRNVTGLDSKILALTTPIPDETEAILYVSFTDLTIDVQGKDAIVTTTANATLRRLSDGEHLYEEDITYQDRDTLSNWTANDNALWRDYANFARHYIGREISAQTFERVSPRHELRPMESETVDRVKKNDWQGISRTPTPTLAWQLTLFGDDAYGAWSKEIGESSIAYDVEIYDLHRLVYAAKQVPDPQHTVAEELDCGNTYRWSVRPVYQVGGDIKFGDWMRFASDNYTAKANVGRQLSVAPAYVQDFASLRIKCRRR